MRLSTEYGKEAVTGIVREIICSILPHLPADAVVGEKSLKDLGADSVDRVEIILSILNRLNLDEPMSSFSGLANIDALVENLCRARQA